MAQKVAEPQTDASFTALLLGDDESGLRPDSIVLVHVDGKQNRIDLLSVPRDSKVYYKGRNHKINSLSQLGGREAVIGQVSDLTGADIKYYVEIKTGALAGIVDALDGVEYTVERDMNYEDPHQNLKIHLKAGRQTLDGAACEQYCRYRSYVMGDLTRTQHQQALLAELLRQKMNARYIAKLPAVYQTLRENSETNLTPTDIVNYLPLVKSMADGKVQIELHDCPGEYNDMKAEGISYYLIDREGLQSLCRECGFAS